MNADSSPATNAATPTASVVRERIHAVPDTHSMASTTFSVRMGSWVSAYGTIPTRPFA